MDFIIGFFRDALDGPLYIIVAIICVILICSCIGYLAEQSLNKKKQKQEYEATHANVNSEKMQSQNNTQVVSENLDGISPVEVENHDMINQVIPTPQPTSTMLEQTQSSVVGTTNLGQQTIGVSSGNVTLGNSSQNDFQAIPEVPIQSNPADQFQPPQVDLSQQIPPQTIGVVPPGPTIINTTSDVNTINQ